jgi:hypothetical protein
VCANGSTQRAYISREEASSPTTASEAITITGVIDAKQKRDVMTLDIPNAFVQAKITLDGDKIIMKIQGQLVDILLELCPGVYDNYAIDEGKHKILYVRMLKALYGMLISSILYYTKFRKDVESIGFEVNPYDICVANRKVNGKQHTVTWYVDDLKSSHVDSKVNDNFTEWCETTYGSDDLGHVKVVRGKIHDYLAMILDFTEDGGCVEDRHDILYQRNAGRLSLCDRNKANDTMDREIIESPKRRQEARRRVAQLISHLCDESYVFVQKSTTRY